MSHTKTFAAIEKLKEVELELHRLKNALEMTNKAYDVKREWVGLTDEERQQFIDWDYTGIGTIEATLRKKNT